MSTKYLFVLDTHVASMVASLVIHHLQLDYNSCYFVMKKSNFHVLSEKMLPENVIFSDKLEQVFTTCVESFEPYAYTAGVQHLIRGVVGKMQAQEYILFTPNVNEFLTYALASAANCRQVNIIERGRGAYEWNPGLRAYTYEPDYIAQQYQKFFEYNPELVPENTGVKSFTPLEEFDFAGLGNPNVTESTVNFFRLTKSAFAQFEAQNNKTSRASQVKFTTFDLDQAHRPTYEGALLRQLYEQGFIQGTDKAHIITLDGTGRVNPTQEDFDHLAYRTTMLIKRVISLYPDHDLLLVHLAKNVSKEEAKFFVELLDKTGLYYMVLPERINLEFELVTAPVNTFYVHGIASELLIYAQAFRQISECYIDLTVDHYSYHASLTNRNYFISSILNEISGENEGTHEQPYCHIFVVTSEVALASTLTLIKQFELNTDHCYMLTDHDNLARVTQIFNEQQVKSIARYEQALQRVSELDSANGPKSQLARLFLAGSYINADVGKLINHNNYSLYTDTMESSLSMVLAANYRCKELNLIEAGTEAAMVDNDFGIEQAHAFYSQVRKYYPQLVAANSMVTYPKAGVNYCFRLRPYAFRQPVIADPIVLINLQVAPLRQLNLYNQVIVPAKNEERIHLLVIDNNVEEYSLANKNALLGKHQYLADYAAILNAMQERADKVEHLYVLLNNPNINIFNQLKNYIIAWGISTSLYYNIDLFSELFYANKQVRVHTMSPRYASYAQFAQQAFTLYKNSIHYDQEVLEQEAARKGEVYDDPEDAPMVQPFSRRQKLPGEMLSTFDQAIQQGLARAKKEQEEKLAQRQAEAAAQANQPQA